MSDGAVPAIDVEHRCTQFELNATRDCMAASVGYESRKKCHGSTQNATTEQNATI